MNSIKNDKICVSLILHKLDSLSMSIDLNNHHKLYITEIRNMLLEYFKNQVLEIEKMKEFTQALKLNKDGTPLDPEASVHFNSKNYKSYRKVKEFDKDKCGHTNYEGMENMNKKEKFKVDKLGWYEADDGSIYQVFYDINKVSFFLIDNHQTPQVVYCDGSVDSCLYNLIKYIGPELPKESCKIKYYPALYKEESEGGITTYYLKGSFSKDECPSPGQGFIYDMHPPVSITFIRLITEIPELITVKE